MQLMHVFDSGLNRVGVLTAYRSLQWEEFYRDAGRFTLTAADTPENIRLLRQGNYLWQNGKDTAMRISFVAYDAAAITVSGYTAVDLLAQRCVPSPVAVTNAEAGMYGIVRDNLRGLPVETAEPRGYDDVFETEAVGDISKELKRIASETDLGYMIAFARIIFRLRDSDGYILRDNTGAFLRVVS